ncbi:hypothetical protein [Rhodopseudomonas sp. BR0G17]|uniref:hypothetical protein n=1 Tax=Rhodopseudomonas sp. BR0G17 TaxID=2269368 RepID=UPI0013DEB8B1|nr:hypothetical protein [Rhodopseudomonas sp. BR0G17]
MTDFLAPVQPKDATLTALAALDASAGLLVETSADSFVKRTLTGTANEISVSNGSGAAGDPTLSLPASLVFTGKTVTGGSFTGPAISSPTGIVKGDVGLGNVDNTSDATKNAAVATLTNKTINASANTISNLTAAMFAANVVDNDSALAANSSTRIPTQAAVKAYADQLIAANDAMVFKGSIDCSANPNYPAADRGWTYKVSVGGKIGGASGVSVENGDTLMCLTDGTASGTQAAVGAQWNIVQANLVGAVTGPASSVSGNIPTFNGTGGTVLQDSGKALPGGAIVGTSDVQALTGKTINGLTITSTTGTLTIAAAKTLVANNSLTLNGTDGSSVAFGAGGTVAYLSNKLSAFAATSSAELAGVMSDETGTGSLVFANGPTLVNPVVGTQTLGDSSTKAASTAFVQNAVAAAVAGVASLGGQSGALTFDGGSMASTVMTLLRYDAAQALSSAQQARARANAGAGNPGLHNRLINPSGQIWQLENSGAAAITDGSYAWDQWYGLTQSAGVTASALVNVEDGTPFMMRLTQANATAQRFGLAQVIEAVNCTDLRGQSVVLSARVRMSAATTLRFAIIEWTGTADVPTKDFVNDWTSSIFSPGNFFTATSTVITASGSITLTANTAASISLAGTVSSAAANIAVLFWTDSAQAQNVTLDIGKAQLEAGLAPTPFAVRSAQDEMGLCKRYLRTTGINLPGTMYLSLGFIFSPTIFRTVIPLGDPMRAGPAVSISSPSHFQADDPAASALVISALAAYVSSPDVAQLQFTISGGTAGHPAFFQALSASARIYFKAQL